MWYSSVSTNVLFTMFFSSWDWQQKSFLPIEGNTKYMSAINSNIAMKFWIQFDVRNSVPHHTIQINQPTRCNNFWSLLLDVYVRLNMFRASPRPSSGANNCTRSLWFYRWKVAVGALLVVADHDHEQQRSNSHSPKVKPEVPSAVVCSWWWAGRHPKHVGPHINVT